VTFFQYMSLRRFPRSFFAASKALGCCAVLSILASSAAPAINDVTSDVIRLGNPSLIRYPDAYHAYARNVWDLKAWNGGIYIGQGNSGNTEPCPNAGPVIVNRYDPAAGGFEGINLLPQEQIQRFVELDGNLCIPGHDPQDGVSDGYYTYDGTAWTTQTLANFVHCYDVRRKGSIVLAAAAPSGASMWGLRMSTNNGIGWTDVPFTSLDPMWPVVLSASRVHALFDFNDEVYCTGFILVADAGATTMTYAELARVDVVTTQAVVLNETDREAMFAGSGLAAGDGRRMERCLQFAGHLVYIAAENMNGSQWVPAGLYRTAAMGSAQAVALPDNSLPWDCLVVEGRLYVLGALAAGAGGCWITVCSSSNLSTWSEDFRFYASAFARSFEYLNGVFYFGLGCSETAPYPTASGDILSYPYIPSPVRLSAFGVE